MPQPFIFCLLYLTLVLVIFRWLHSDKGDGATERLLTLDFVDKRKDSEPVNDKVEVMEDGDTAIGGENEQSKYNDETKALENKNETSSVGGEDTGQKDEPDGRRRDSPVEESAVSYDNNADNQSTDRAPSTDLQQQKESEQDGKISPDKNADKDNTDNDNNEAQPSGEVKYNDLDDSKTSETKDDDSGMPKHEDNVNKDEDNAEPEQKDDTEKPASENQSSDNDKKNDDRSNGAVSRAGSHTYRVPNQDE